jgi:hypothetical protein
MPCTTLLANNMFKTTPLINFMEPNITLVSGKHTKLFM